MKTEDFSFHLPEGLIAQEPADPRDVCRLMVLDRSNNRIAHHHFYDLPKFLKPGDVLVMNNSKVLPARMLFQHEGKDIELFLLRRERGKDLYSEGYPRMVGDFWLAIGKPGRLLQPGKIFHIAPDFSFEILEILPDGQRRIQFHADEDKLDGLIEKYGHTPLPPYIKKSESKPEDYQTVFAEHKGSVAAPTAGLHFTPELLTALKNMGVKIVFVTLHVGLGTFMPIKTGEVEKHTMHSEIFELSEESAAELQTVRKEGGRIIAVGTTSVRVLESSFDAKKGFQPQVGETSIYIYPGYEWKCVDGLITNFHLPQSTLLLLTCSFGGKDFILEAYREAIEEGYRFYSFGDAMLIV